MSNNPSVRQFRADMAAFANTVGKTFHQQKLDQADEIIGDMERAISHQVTGHLAQSLRKKDVSVLPEKVSILILAGGQLTTRRSAAGAFDYALAEEFGTQHEAPHPFFYGTFRAYQRQGVEQDRETFEQLIEENNKVRALRSQNYNTAFSGVVSTSHYGAVVIQKGRR